VVSKDSPEPFRETTRASAEALPKAETMMFPSEHAAKDQTGLGTARVSFPRQVESHAIGARRRADQS